LSMESKQIYQIRNRKDGVILAQYESKRPALREKKILSSMGLDVQIYSLFVSDRKPKRKRKPRKSLIKPKVEWADDIPLIVPRDAAIFDQGLEEHRGTLHAGILSWNESLFSGFEEQRSFRPTEGRRSRTMLSYGGRRKSTVGVG